MVSPITSHEKLCLNKVEWWTEGFVEEEDEAFVLGAREFEVEDVVLHLLPTRVYFLARSRCDRVDCFKGFSVDVEFTVKTDALEVLLDESGGDVRESEFVAIAGNEHWRLTVEPFYPAAFAIELWLDEKPFT